MQGQGLFCIGIGIVLVLLSIGCIFTRILAYLPLSSDIWSGGVGVDVDEWERGRNEALVELLSA